MYGINDGITIIIILFIALQEDIQQRCRTMGISCEIWGSAFGIQDASILLVTPESFVTYDFREFLNRLSVRFQLDRIIFDKCYTILDTSIKFR